MNNETNNLTVEWAPFEVAPHVSDEQLITASQVLEKDFLQKQKGYVRRELLKGKDRQWVDLVYWSTPEDAAMAAQCVNASQACKHYFSLMVGVENAEEGVSHYTRIKQWG